MKIKSRVLVGLMIMIFCLGSASVVSAVAVHGGYLQYEGGQTSDKVYSKIYDVRPTDMYPFKVLAMVKVCDATSTSTWKSAYAYTDAPRKWYCNEKSWYDYKLLF